MPLENNWRVIDVAVQFGDMAIERSWDNGLLRKILARGSIFYTFCSQVAISSETLPDVYCLLAFMFGYSYS